jgi:hypothetical protein
MVSVALVGVGLGLSLEVLRFYRWYRVWSVHAEAERTLRESADVWERAAAEDELKAARGEPYVLPVELTGPLRLDPPKDFPLSWKERADVYRENARRTREEAKAEARKKQAFHWLGP